MAKTATEIDADPSILRDPAAQHKQKPTRSGQGHGRENQAATGKKRQPPGAFIMARLAMLDSVAYWTLKSTEVRILQVIEIEHMRHGGVENGNLIVTRRQLEKRGIPHKAIAPGLRALEVLGFIEITQRGAAASATTPRLTVFGSPTSSPTRPTSGGNTMIPNALKRRQKQCATMLMYVPAA
jgi:hypothetical protein